MYKAIYLKKPYLPILFPCDDVSLTNFCLKIVQKMQHLKNLAWNKTNCQPCLFLPSFLPLSIVFGFHAEICVLGGEGDAVMTEDCQQAAK